MDPSLYQSTTSKSSDSSSDDKLGNNIVDYDLQNRIDNHNDIIEEQVEEVLASRQDLEPETPPAKSFVNLQSPLQKKLYLQKNHKQITGKMTIQMILATRLVDSIKRWLFSER